MAKKCIETSFSSPHAFKPGSTEERRQLEADHWEVCGRPGKHEIHKPPLDPDGGTVPAS